MVEITVTEKLEKKINVEFPLFHVDSDDHWDSVSRIDYIGGENPFRYSHITRYYNGNKEIDWQFSVGDYRTIGSITTSVAGWYSDATQWRSVIASMRSALQQLAEFGSLDAASDSASAARMGRSMADHMTRGSGKN